MKKFEYLIENEMTGAPVSGSVEAETLAKARSAAKAELDLAKRRSVFKNGLKLKSVKEVA